MNEKKATVKFLCLLGCLLVLTGCDRSSEERDKAIAKADKAIAEAEQVKAELARVEDALGETQSERDSLEETIAEVSEKLENANSQLIASLQAQEQWQAKFDELAKQHDDAIAEITEIQTTVEKPEEQLKEKTADISEYEQWVKELQETIEYLENQIDQMSEKSDEEVADGNNV